MCSFSENGPSKKDYRLFNIPNEIAGNDIASLEHVIERRLKYYDEKRPDIILVDGGETQLNLQIKFLKDHGIPNILVLAIAKVKEG